MKVELRKVKHHKDMSEETPCYSAEVWIDGVKVGAASNDGHGGADRLSPTSLYETLSAHAKTLPTRRFAGSDAYQPTYETVLADAFDAFTVRRAFDRDLKKRVLVMRERDGAVLKTRTLLAADHARAVRERDAIAYARGEKVLNLMPLDEAFAIYVAATAPKEDA